MNILVDIGHPAHVHLFRNLITLLGERGHKVVVTVRDLPPATTLLGHYGIPYIIIGSRGGSLAGKGLTQLLLDIRMVKLGRKHSVDLAIGSSITVAHASRLGMMRSVVFDDDDDEVQPLMTRFGHPFAHRLLSPAALRGHRRQRSAVYYEGYHELAYLHPGRFTPDPAIPAMAGLKPGEKYFIMRFNLFKAHHDTGVHGLTLARKLRLAERLSEEGKVFVTTEGKLEPELEKYRFPVAPHLIHSFLAGATLFAGDSQTMTSEAAVLGVPALRCNTLARSISYLNEQELKYGLTYGFLPAEFENMMKKIDELLSMPNLKEEWQRRRHVMLSEKIDVTSFMLNYLEDYYNSFAGPRTHP